jgi:hypothetical protein
MKMRWALFVSFVSAADKLMSMLKALQEKSKSNRVFWMSMKSAGGVGFEPAGAYAFFLF